MGHLGCPNLTPSRTEPFALLPAQRGCKSPKAHGLTRLHACLNARCTPSRPLFPSFPATSGPALHARAAHCLLPPGRGGPVFYIARRSQGFCSPPSNPSPLSTVGIFACCAHDFSFISENASHGECLRSPARSPSIPAQLPAKGCTIIQPRPRLPAAATQ